MRRLSFRNLWTVLSSKFKSSSPDDRNDDDCPSRRSWVSAIENVKKKLEDETAENEGDTAETSVFVDMFGKKGRKLHKSGKSKVTFENFEFIKMLGKGTFGKVILCR